MKGALLYLSTSTAFFITPSTATLPKLIEEKWWRHDRRNVNDVSVTSIARGAPTGGEGPAPPPLEPEKHYIFRVASVKLRDLHL